VGRGHLRSGETINLLVKLSPPCNPSRRLAFLRELPVPVPYAYLRGLDVGKAKQDTGIGSGLPYLMGRVGLENAKLKGFKEYYIIAFLYKVPIATQLLLFIAIISLIRYRQYINFWQNEAFLSIPALFFFIALSLTTAQLGIRYILMIAHFKRPDRKILTINHKPKKLATANRHC
jgi:hypothetical protein